MTDERVGRSQHGWRSRVMTMVAGEEEAASCSRQTSAISRAAVSAARRVQGRGWRGRVTDGQQRRSDSKRNRQSCCHADSSQAGQGPRRPRRLSPESPAGRRRLPQSATGGRRSPCLYEGGDDGSRRCSPLPTPPSLTSILGWRQHKGPSGDDATAPLQAAAGADRWPRRRQHRSLHRRPSQHLSVSDHSTGSPHAAHGRAGSQRSDGADGCGRAGPRLR